MRIILLLTLFMVTVEARAAGADAMFPSRGSAFTAPDRAFSLTLPSTWQAALVPGETDTVQFLPSNLPGHGSLYIRRLTVPAGAHPRQLLLNSLEGRLKKLPGFRMLQKRDVMVAGHPGAVVVGGFDFHGNAQYPRTLEEVYVVAGTDAYIFHFECAAPAAPAYAADLQKMYASFQPRAAATNSAPFAVENEEEVDDSALPF